MCHLRYKFVARIFLILFNELLNNGNVKKIIVVLFLIPIVSFCQNSELSIFENLVGKKWIAEGSWGDGSQFKQEVIYEYSLDGAIVITNSIGFIDKEQKTLGPRNHGVRMYDEESDTIKFWEFDVFGGLTIGIVFTIGKDIYYQYPYGNSFITEVWEYIDETSYNFKVGNYEDGEWKQLYLSTQFLAK